LPLNETGMFCPYDSESSFALESVYLSLSLLPAAKKKKFSDRLYGLRKKFPSGQSPVDYGIKKEKLDILWEMFLEEDLDEQQEFFAYRKKNAYWLEDFAIFKVLKAHHQGAVWYEWEQKYKDRDTAALQVFSAEHLREISFQVWVQWQLFEQFKEAKQYAGKNKVFFKGDLPILVSRDSADVWSHPDYFKLGFAAGAPPDMYCAKGQRWGMPTYDWDAIAGGNFRYLKEKLKYAENFYDILRVDHVVGLFRIWSIPFNDPQEDQGLNGVFDPADKESWGQHGKNLLTVMLKNTSMLLCAEDLGTIPPVCPRTLAELGIPGNDVQRWTKEWVKKHDFLSPEEFRVPSVAMLSTHDTTICAACWEYEFGTVDEQLFIRKCADHRNIDFNRVKDVLFDFSLSRYGRLRWLKSVDSVEKLVNILGRKKEEIVDFIDLYENSYLEKEKLWGVLELKGPLREKADPEIVAALLKITENSASVFCVELITDLLYAGGLIQGDPYNFRINFPGTTGSRNWSLIMPISLEELIRHPVTKKLKMIITEAGRA
jgi:4-alpha-glucanotransferase